MSREEEIQKIKDLIEDGAKTQVYFVAQGRFQQAIARALVIMLEDRGKPYPAETGLLKPTEPKE